MDTANTTGAALLDRRIGDVVAEDYTRAATFNRFGIDFCCGGGRTVAEACRKVGIEPEQLIDELEGASGTGGVNEDERSWSASRLIEHIESEHHAYVRRTLPALRAFTEKVARVHGPGTPSLVEVRDFVVDLEAELTEHMQDEEVGLFPKIVAMESETPEQGGAPEELLGELEDDHERAGNLMKRIRHATDDFTPPAEACATYRASFALLEEFEADLHRHVHLENNVLFPMARRMVSEVKAGGAEG